jgi:oligopeptide/dipeptide ABC transporter ATP-binding protein
MTQQQTATGAVVDFIGRASFAGLPTEAIAIAKRCIVDGLGVLLAGSTQDAGRILHEHVRGTDPRTDSTVFGRAPNLLDDLKSSMGLTLLFIAHDLSMVRYVSDRMAVMYLGSLIEIGPANKVYFEPKHPYTQLLVGSNPEPDPTTEHRRRGTLIKGEIPSPINVPAGCRFANRCPHVMDVCRQVTPVLKVARDEPAADRTVACHLY